MSKQQKWIIRQRISSLGYVEKDQTVNPIVSEWNRLAQRDTGLGMTRWEKWSTENSAIDKKLSMLTKWLIHKLESVQENVMHRILWDFEMDHSILAKRSHLVLINQKNKTKKKKNEKEINKQKKPQK